MPQSYKTEQKEKLLAFFAEHAEAQFTAKEVFEQIGAEGMGQSTVYRLLAKMAEEGVLRCFAAGASSPASYQYIGQNDECRHHFHLKCMACGKIQHLECGLSRELLKHIRSDHGFTVDSGKSILFGLCRECSGNAFFSSLPLDPAEGHEDHHSH